jgi:hypothetical protein
MNLSNAFLAKCAALKQAGYEAELSHALVARGFADLGYEAFSVLPGDKLLSLFTGKITPITMDEFQHLFLVPAADDLIQFIQRNCGYEINCHTIDGRSWHVTMGQNIISVDVPSASLAETLLEVAIKVLSSLPNA